MTPFLLVPGLNCDARVYAGVAQALWPHGPVTIANHAAGASIEEIAKAILADAPPKFSAPKRPFLEADKKQKTRSAHKN